MEDFAESKHCADCLVKKTQSSVSLGHADSLLWVCCFFLHKRGSGEPSSRFNMGTKGDNPREILIQCYLWKAFQKRQLKSLHTFPRAAITNARQSGSSKQQKWILSEFQRLKVQTQGDSVVMCPSYVGGKNPSLLLPSFSW